MSGHVLDTSVRPAACSCGKAKYAGSPTFVRERHAVHVEDAALATPPAPTTPTDASVGGERGGADRQHDNRGQLDRSTCGACGDAYWECSKCGVYFCECSRSGICTGGAS